MKTTYIVKQFVFTKTTYNIKQKGLSAFSLKLLLGSKLTRGRY